MTSRATNKCNYLSPRGVCGKSCWRERCTKHIRLNHVYSPCSTCGVPTRSVYGLCNKHSSTTRSRKFREGKAMKEIEENERPIVDDEYIEQLLASLGI